MQLTVPIGATVNVVIDAHSAVDGANFPAGKIAVVSNGPEVATVPSDPITSDGTTSQATVPVTILTSGSTDVSATLTTADGSQFTDTATLIVTPAVPGFTHLTVTLVQS